MSRPVALAARVDAGLDIELTRLANATGRSKSWLINEALRSYIANERHLLAAVEEGKQALREGRVIDHATVVMRLIGFLRRTHDAAAVDGTRQLRFSRDFTMVQVEESVGGRSRRTAHS